MGIRMFNPMLKRIQHTLESLGYILAWIALIILATLTGFQIHSTLIAIAVVVVNNPSLRPYGWTTQTIYGFSSFVWVVLGIIWLAWVNFTFEYLNEGLQNHILGKRIFRLMLILGIIYSLCYGILYLL